MRQQYFKKMNLHRRILFCALTSMDENFYEWFFKEVDTMSEEELEYFFEFCMQIFEI